MVLGWGLSLFLSLGLGLGLVSSYGLGLVLNLFVCFGWGDLVAEPGAGEPGCGTKMSRARHHPGLASLVFVRDLPQQMPRRLKP